MKKLGVFFITTLLSATTILATPIKIQVNGKEILNKVAPITQNGTTLVPLRVISEELGAFVEWSSATNTITIYSDLANLQLSMGSLEMTKLDFASNSETQITLTLAPIQINSTTMVPLRAISEGLGCNINYASGVIDINSPTTTVQPGSPQFTEETKLIIQNDLTNKYGICQTVAGDIPLTFSLTVNENKLKYYPCDFEIAAKLSEQDIAHLKNLTLTAPDTAVYVKKQLQSHMGQLALELITTYPEAKFWGYYDLSHYETTDTKQKLITSFACTWMNYMPDKDLTYAGSKKGLFTWFTSYDTEIW